MAPNGEVEPPCQGEMSGDSVLSHLLGVSVAAGRFFDGARGGNRRGLPVVVLSHDSVERGSSARTASVIGKTILRPTNRRSR
jgi:hypothetical protein